MGMDAGLLCGIAQRVLLKPNSSRSASVSAGSRYEYLVPVLLNVRAVIVLVGIPSDISLAGSSMQTKAQNNQESSARRKPLGTYRYLVAWCMSPRLLFGGQPEDARYSTEKWEHEIRLADQKPTTTMFSSAH